MGIEPTLPAWKAGTLPLSYTREGGNSAGRLIDSLGVRSVPVQGKRVGIRAVGINGMGGAGFEPAKAVPPDLQSVPFGRLGIHPGMRREVG